MGLISRIQKELQKLNNIMNQKRNANQNYIKIQSHPVRMAIIKKTTINIGKDAGETFIQCWWGVN
jgi:hypothetical protein